MIVERYTSTTPPGSSTASPASIPSGSGLTNEQKNVPIDKSNEISYVNLGVGLLQMAIGAFILFNPGEYGDWLLESKTFFPVFCGICGFILLITGCVQKLTPNYMKSIDGITEEDLQLPMGIIGTGLINMFVLPLFHYFAFTREKNLEEEKKEKERRKKLIEKTKTEWDHYDKEMKDKIKNLEDDVAELEKLKEEGEDVSETGLSDLRLELANAQSQYNSTKINYEQKLHEQKIKALESKKTLEEAKVQQEKQLRESVKKYGKSGRSVSDAPSPAERISDVQIPEALRKKLDQDTTKLTTLLKPLDSGEKSQLSDVKNTIQSITTTSNQINKHLIQQGIDKKFEGPEVLQQAIAKVQQYEPKYSPPSPPFSLPPSPPSSLPPPSPSYLPSASPSSKSFIDQINEKIEKTKNETANIFKLQKSRKEKGKEEISDAGKKSEEKTIEMLRQKTKQLENLRLEVAKIGDKQEKEIVFNEGLKKIESSAKERLSQIGKETQALSPKKTIVKVEKLQKTDVKSEEKKESLPEKKIELLPEGWMEYQDQRGVSYYYNTKTNQTQWDKPEDIFSPSSPGSPGDANQLKRAQSVIKIDQAEEQKKLELEKVKKAEEEKKLSKVCDKILKDEKNCDAKFIMTNCKDDLQKPQYKKLYEERQKACEVQTKNTIIKPDPISKVVISSIVQQAPPKLSQLLASKTNLSPEPVKQDVSQTKASPKQCEEVIKDCKKTKEEAKKICGISDIMFEGKFALLRKC
jgi:hypothetical protein